MAEFLEKFGWEKLLNRKGTTWRKLSAEEQSNITDNKSALKLMQENSSIIKRPIVDLWERKLVGFEVKEWGVHCTPN